MITQELNKKIEEISEAASLLFMRAWAEKNAGNISYNVTEVMPEGQAASKSGIRLNESRTYSGLSGQWLLITAANSRMRDLAANPYRYLCLINIDSEGKINLYRFNEDSESFPTSELATHLDLHTELVKKSSGEKAVLHTHPDNLIALSHIREFKSTESLSNLIWSMHPEAMIYLPEGIGFIPYYISGSEKLAKGSILALKHKSIALWEKHGVIAIGQSPLDAFDLVETASKSAGIYFKCKSAGFEPEGLNDFQMSELKEKFSKS